MVIQLSTENNKAEELRKSSEIILEGLLSLSDGLFDKPLKEKAKSLEGKPLAEVAEGFCHMLNVGCHAGLTIDTIMVIMDAIAKRICDHEGLDFEAMLDKNAKDLELNI
jgi:hypothetical protein